MREILRDFISTTSTHVCFDIVGCRVPRSMTSTGIRHDERTGSRVLSASHHPGEEPPPGTRRPRPRTCPPGHRFTAQQDPASHSTHNTHHSAPHRLTARTPPRPTQPGPTSTWAVTETTNRIVSRMRRVPKQTNWCPWPWSQGQTWDQAGGHGEEGSPHLEGLPSQEWS